MPIDLSYVGKTLDKVTYSYTERDVMLYALGIGCGREDLKFTYEKDLQVLPTFAVVASFPAMMLLGGVLRVNPAMVLHGEQAIALKAPIPTRGTLTTTPTIGAVYDKGKGAVAVIETDTVDERGNLLFHNTASIFVRGEGGFGGERGPSGPRNVPPDRKPDKSISYKTLPQQALVYRLSGDMKPAARRPGLRQARRLRRTDPAWPLHVRTRRPRRAGKRSAANDPKRLKAFEVRFSGVVFPARPSPPTCGTWAAAPSCSPRAPNAATRSRRPRRR
jgi:hypothetical protein